MNSYGNYKPGPDINNAHAYIVYKCAFPPPTNQNAHAHKLDAIQNCAIVEGLCNVMHVYVPIGFTLLAPYA